MKAAAAQRSCPQCGATAVHVVHAGRYVLPEGHPLDAAVRVVVCDRCGFCFNDTPATRADYDRYYRDVSKYADPQLSSGAGYSPEDTARLKATAKTISEFAQARDTRILDIGCGAGGLLDSLATLGFHDLTGMDPAAACAKEVSRRGHCGVVGTFDEHPLSAASFDGIILSHVLEHVRDLSTALANVARLLRPAGWLYVEVPDASRYGECLIAPFQDFNLEHINHFSAATLRNLLARHGWSVASCGSKTLPLAHGRSYPAVYAFARQRQAEPDGPDCSLRDALADYVAKSSKHLAQIDGVLRDQSGSLPVFVWGVGQLTMRLLGETSLGRAAITAFIDSNPIHHGRTLAGRPIISPDALASSDMTASPIIIGSLVNVESIEASIRERGLGQRIIRLDAAGSC
jgi:ubiquinone/menaquinone biosynthesis C-methylase UbiE